MRGRELMARAERLEAQAARAAYAGALATYDGRRFDAAAWNARADRLEAQALKCRTVAKTAA